MENLNRTTRVEVPAAGEPRPAPAPPADESGHEWRLGRFPNLMDRRVEEILLVSSAYDSFILEEDGLLSELIFSEFADLGLTHAPRVTRVNNGEEALDALARKQFDLMITMLRLGDMDIFEFTRTVRRNAPYLPVVLLISNELELGRLGERRGEMNVSGMYVWHGDAKLFLAIIKLIEDRWNADYDTKVGGVGVIILVEDSVRYRSVLLPLMYGELVKQTRSVMLEGINRMQKLLRTRARPKILAAESYEEAVALYERYRDYIFGLITDVSFVRGGKMDPSAGVALVRHVKNDNPDVPVLMQSSDPQNRLLAEQVKAGFLHKRSSTLLQDLRAFMLDNFGFGDFVFRLPDGREAARAADLRSMLRVLPTVPGESLMYHAQRNHFSNWLRARTEFALARALRPRKASEFADAEALRRFLIESFNQAIVQARRGVVEDFSRERFDPDASFARIGGGSLGGKARGLAFCDALLERHELTHAWQGIRVYVPRSAVIGTDVFDRFLDENQLRITALYNASDEWIRQVFLKAELPAGVVGDLRAYLQRVRLPIAVRSSSLLEDSQYYPFAGVYDTYMLPNNHPDERVRLLQLCDAVKLVYASSFYAAARRYLEATPHRIEEEKMAVVLQRIVGAPHEPYFYPNFAGVARSYNFYPFGHMKPEDGVAVVGLGLGRLVVQGGEALRFCPAHPLVLPQLAEPEAYLDQSQRGFYAIDLNRSDDALDPAASAVVRLDLDLAERHGTLAPVGSVWSPEDLALYDGIHRRGPRLVTFAHVLKSGVFPLADILKRVLELGRQGVGGPVELEFAVNLESEPKRFAILQLRPYGAGREAEPVELDIRQRDELVCYSTQAMGNGLIRGLYDVVYVKPDTFDAARTRQIAQEIGRFNDALRAENRPYLLIGLGRWGSTNPWLGIPVNWPQIAGARVIVETSLENFVVDPSQGSHFFHNLTSAGTAYLTVNPRADGNFVDWQWLAAQPAAGESELVRHVRLPMPIEARIDGRCSRAAVFKSERPSAYGQ